MPADPRTRDELIEAMQDGACPICVIVNRAERKAIDHFLYDQVNDISRRDTLRASRGYCLHHTALLAEGRSALGVAILSRDILRAMTAELEESSRDGSRTGPTGFSSLFAAKNGPKLATKIEPHAPCPMCVARPQIEEPLFLGLLQNLDDPTFRQAVQASQGGMCRTHLATALRMASNEAAQTLATIQATQWRQIEAALDEFIRKHDYRFREEVMDDERDVWLRALRLSSGWLE